MNFARYSAGFIGVLSVGFAALSLRAESVELLPVKDNTLYQSSTGTYSNGQGDYFFVGLNAQTINRIRRALLAFNVAGSIPAGAIIDSAQLTCTMSMTQSQTIDVTLHRVLADWGESTSNASGEEGSGGTAANGDATWIHRFRPTLLWSTAGGSFLATPSATTVVTGDFQPFTWGSSSGMVADVQFWLDNPASNFGWLMKTPVESGGGASAKRFNTREHPDVASRPRLLITYHTPQPPQGDMNCDMSIDAADVELFVDAILDSAGYQIEHPECGAEYADLNDDTRYDGRDIAPFIDLLTLP